MAYTLNNIEEAVDGKFLVTKGMSHQAEIGSIVHIMDAQKIKNGSLLIKYRITETGQNYDITFPSIKEFCAWAKPDKFIARNYKSFTKEEIQHYVKVNNRTFTSFCLPILAVALVVIWAVAFIAMSPPMNIILGIILSIAAFALVSVIFKKQKTSVKMNLYKKASSHWGIEFD